MNDGTNLTLAAVAALAVAGAMRRMGSRALADYDVVIEHTSQDGTVAKGSTRPIKELLKQHRFRWYRTGGFWYIPRTRGLEESPIDLDALREEAEAILSGEQEPPNVVAFRPRSKPAPPRPVRGHVGDVTYLTSDGGSVSLSDIYGSVGITFGTSAPYAVGYVGPDRVGYADTPMISVEMYGKDKDSGALVPIARQLAMVTAAVNGLYLNMGPPSVSAGRQRMMTDKNPSSRSVGKTKRLREMTYRFEVRGTSYEDVGIHRIVKSRYSSGTPDRRLIQLQDGTFAHTGEPYPLARRLTREEIVKTGHVKS